LGELTRLGVLGWPVAHSRSPAMHNAALKAVGLTGWRYQRLPVGPELFDDAVRALPRAGFAGANVTIPHKEAALAVAGRATPTARAIGAANTLSFGADGSIRADNTDAPALVELLCGARPATALVLGAGGSARAAVHALAGLGAEVAVWNRRAERARALAAELGARAVARPQAGADVLVNCTAVGLGDPERTFIDLPLGVDDLGHYESVIDLVYRPGGTLLLREARRRGSRVVDGLEFLVAQGALSFRLWTGREAPRAVMREAAADRTVSL
jgi:shikimate dehydrogenase